MAEKSMGRMERGLIAFWLPLSRGLETKEEKDRVTLYS